MYIHNTTVAHVCAYVRMYIHAHCVHGYITFVRVSGRLYRVSLHRVDGYMGILCTYLLYTYVCTYVCM